MHVNPNKQTLVQIVCSACNITDINDESAWRVLVTNNRQNKIKDLFTNKLDSLAADMIEYYLNVKMADNFYGVYLELMKNNIDVFDKLLKYNWDIITSKWLCNQTDQDYFKFFYNYIWNFMTTHKEMYNSFQQTYDNFIKTKNIKDAETCDSFVFGCISTMQEYMYSLIKMMLINDAVKCYSQSNNSNANSNNNNGNTVEESKATDYQVYSFGGCAVNSLLRIYYGRHGHSPSKMINIAITRSMMLSYNKTDSEQKEYDQIPKRLIMENNGGLRIIRKVFVPYVQKVLNIIINECPNLLIKYKNDFSQMLKLIETEQNKQEFFKLFVKDKVVATLKRGDKQQGNPNDQYDKCLEKVYKDFNHAIFAKAVWAYVKDKRSGPERTSLRQKLSIYHNTSNRAKIPRC